MMDAQLEAAEVGDEVAVGPRPRGWRRSRVRVLGSSDGLRWRELELVWVFSNERREDVLVVAEETWHEVA